MVNWIDSKATFGDPTSHAEYHANQCVASAQQLWVALPTAASMEASLCAPTSLACTARRYSGYLNRFDCGLVIYWFGFDETIDLDPRVHVLDAFPTDCEVMAYMPAHAASEAQSHDGGIHALAQR